jgi:hypothetical protein
LSSELVDEAFDRRRNLEINPAPKDNLGFIRIVNVIFFLIEQSAMRSILTIFILAAAFWMRLLHSADAADDECHVHFENLFASIYDPCLPSLIGDVATICEELLPIMTETQFITLYDRVKVLPLRPEGRLRPLYFNHSFSDLLEALRVADNLDRRLQTLNTKKYADSKGR